LPALNQDARSRSASAKRRARYTCSSLAALNGAWRQPAATAGTGRRAYDINTTFAGSRELRLV